jgi:hypothetical protein
MSAPEPPSPGLPAAGEASILDHQLPAYDVAIAEQTLIDADADTTWAALEELDLLQVRTPVITAAFWVRSIPDRLRRHPVPVPPEIRLRNGVDLPGWVGLGQRPGRELAFGAVGRFWKGSIEWHDVEPDHFATFAEPGYGKIAASFSIQPYGEDQSLLTYHCRTGTTDEGSRRAFARYWRLIQPFVGHIMRAAVTAVRDDAERRARARS